VINEHIELGAKLHQQKENLKQQAESARGLIAGSTRLVNKSREVQDWLEKWQLTDVTCKDLKNEALEKVKQLIEGTQKLASDLEPILSSVEPRLEKFD